MKKSTSQVEYLDSQRNKLYEVVKVQLHTMVENYDLPHAFGMYKIEGGRALGVVGEKFTPTQPLFLFDEFMSAIQQIMEVNLSTLKVVPLKEGSKLKISCNVGEYVHTDASGEPDKVTLKLNIITGYDGLTKMSLFLSTYRKRSKVTMKAWTTEYQTSFKNTAGNMGKINLLCQDMSKVMEASEKYVENLKNLGERAISKKERETYIEKVTGLSFSDESLSSKGKNILNEVNEAVLKQMEELGKNAYALLYGVATYTNKKGAERDSKNDYLFVDAGRLMNEKAQKEAFALLK